MACEGSQPVPELPLGSLRKYLLKCHTFPLPPQTLFICPLAGQPCFLSASGWSVGEQFNSSTGIVLPHCPFCYGHHPSYFLRWFGNFAEMGHLWSKSCAQSQGSFKTAHCLRSAQNTVLGLQGSPPVSRGSTNFCCSHFQHKALNISCNIKSLQVFSSKTYVKIWVTQYMIYQGHDKQPLVTEFWIWSEHLF